MYSDDCERLNWSLMTRNTVKVEAPLTLTYLSDRRDQRALDKRHGLETDRKG